MSDNADAIIDPEQEQLVALEPPPAFADERNYLDGVAALPLPTPEQIEDFVIFVSQAKSWYKHLPVRPPGAPMYFYLDPNAGRDRLRRWGHRVVFRDRTKNTEKLHYSWMTTSEYRRRFGYLAFCCSAGSGIWMDEVLSDGVATLDCNVSEPLIEGKTGELLLVPEVVLEAGACLVTRIVHPRTDAGMFRKKWIRANEDVDREPLRGHWPKLADLCEELAREPAGRRFKKLEGELNELTKKQRAEDHGEMKVAIENMLGFVQRAARHELNKAKSRSTMGQGIRTTNRLKGDQSVMEKDTIEDRIAKLERELGAIPFPMYRGDSHGPQLRPGETEAELWLRRLEEWLHVRRSDPSLWDKMVRGD